MENIRKYRDIKLVTTDKKRSKLVSEPNYKDDQFKDEQADLLRVISIGDQ